MTIRDCNCALMSGRGFEGCSTVERSESKGVGGEGVEAVDGVSSEEFQHRSASDLG